MDDYYNAERIRKQLGLDTPDDMLVGANKMRAAMIGPFNKLADEGIARGNHLQYMGQCLALLDVAERMLIVLSEDEQFFVRQFAKRFAESAFRAISRDA